MPAEISRTVTNAFKLLTSFTQEGPVLTPSLLAQRLQISRTATLRLIATLERFRMLERTQDGAGYTIGIRAFELGALYFASRPLNSPLNAALDDLVQRTGCTAYLGVLDGDDLVTLSCREGTSPVRFIYRPGSRLPCTTTAIGKAILMHLEPDMIDRQLGREKKLRRLTGNSLRTRAELDRELAIARRRGWSLAREEAHAGLTATGAAILDLAGLPIAGISLSFFDQPPDPERCKRFGTLVRRTAKALSKTLAVYHQYGERLAVTFDRMKENGAGRDPPDRRLRRLTISAG